MHSKFPFLALVSVLTIILAACGAQASPSVPPAYSQPTAQAAIPATGATATSMPPATQPPASASSGGDYGYGSGSSAATQPPTEASAGSAAQVALASNAQFGSILVGASGMTLYMFTKDSGSISSCYGGCASAWPPLLVDSGSPSAAAGLDASKLGTTARTDGTTQITYNGFPLYFFAKDKQPGDVKGQGLNSAWYVLSASGDPIK